VRAGLARGHRLEDGLRFCVGEGEVGGLRDFPLGI